MEYRLAFARQLIEAARAVKPSVDLFEEAKRTLLYLSLLSIEISLKYLLEKAGVPVKEIRKRSHNIEALLNDLGKCEVRVNIGGSEKWVSASRIRSRIVSPMYAGATIGSLLEGERKGASRYPNEIRYGKPPRHFPPRLVFDCAVKVAEWADDYSARIRAQKESAK